MELFGHGTLYIQRGVASGARSKRFTLCRKYISRRIFKISGVTLFIMDFGRIKIPYCGHHETVNSFKNRLLDKYYVQRVPEELCFATRKECVY